MGIAVISACVAVSFVSSVAAAPSTRQVGVAVGRGHACALSGSGTVKCWGSNNAGQVGNGAEGGVVSKPVAVLSGASAIAAGDNHSCAVLRTGTVECWGMNDAGEAGNGTSGADATRPVTVKGVGGTGVLTGVTAIAAGGDHTCALLRTGTVKCWGQNNYGVLGNGSTKNSPVPVSVTGLLRVTAISMSAQVACARLQGQTVKCWGYTGDGQLGVGTNGPEVCSFSDFDEPCSTTARPVRGVSQVTGISVGQNHTCALLANANVECWGVNTHNATAPVVVRGLASVKQVSTNGDDDHSCALVTNGAVRCFPYDTPTSGGTPFTVNSLGTAAVLAVGGQFSCAALVAGTVKCWNNGTSAPKPQGVSGL